MKVLVTGGAGFLGSHVADTLENDGHDVTIFDQARSPYISSGQKMEIGDILNTEKIEACVKGIDVIYHFAGIADIGEAQESPRRTIENNIIGTLNLLEAANRHKVSRFIFASSIYVYSDKGSFYRTSKQACERMISDFHDNFNLPYTILRYGSLYGPRADPRNSVHRMLEQALSQSRIEYPGTGDEVREYIHVHDAAKMSVEILSEEFENQIIHLTGRERMKVREVLEIIQEILPGDITLEFQDKGMEEHYFQTPYNYTPRLGRKLTPHTYIDLGLGLLNSVVEIDQNKSDREFSNDKNHKNNN